jgi:hypothetical protein
VKNKNEKSEVKKHLCAAAATMKIEPEREIFCVCACVKKKNAEKNIFDPSHLFCAR